MDPITDMITRITNAQAVGHERVDVPFSKVKLHIAQLLKSAGYLAEVERRKRKGKKVEIEYLELTLKYHADGVAGQAGAISGVRIVSRPSRHIYIKAADIRPVRSGYGSAILSTSKGIMMSQEAKKQGLGGEVMFEIW
ncbi:MAG: 30S ribosomal protein S8 [Candidatus Yanofskybacteria bacterium]|nr:30S ribosomal protein S8 [Candidatus Yanofskybacteria bacterium]